MNNCKIFAFHMACARLSSTVERTTESFNDVVIAQKAFKENQPLEKTPSKYINKPRHNFKRR